MTSGKISIIILLFNHITHLEKYIRSAIAQTCGENEVIVIDDGAKDGSRALIEKLIQKYTFTFVAHEKNGCLQNAKQSSKSVFIREIHCITRFSRLLPPRQICRTGSDPRGQSRCGVVLHKGRRVR